MGKVPVSVRAFVFHILLPANFAEEAGENFLVLFVPKR